jgi:probable non-F420 flavinoid oxidoreductase
LVQVGYHASHEQFSPRELLELVRAAEVAGFTAGSCSDHFHPWTKAQGESGFAWAWLGAALQATQLSFGVVNAPGDRYHPAVIAQAAATLAQMYPGRFWLAVGSGEALNEHITGARWPLKPERNARLRECVDVMRALWAGESVTHRGLIDVVDAKLYTLPAEPVRLFGAAVTPATAALVGAWGDGLLTVSQPRDQLRKVADAFRGAGGEGKPMALQLKVAYADDDAAAIDGAFDQWRGNIFGSDVLATLATPAEFEAASELVQRSDVAERVHCSSDPARHAEWIASYAEMGFDPIYVHNVARTQRAFIEAYGERVLPQVASVSMAG